MESLTPATGTTTLRGHAEEVAELFRQHNRALVAFLRCRLNSLGEAQELAQDAYMRLLMMENPERVDSLRAYLFRVAGNLAVDRLRMRKLRSGEPAEPADPAWHYAPIPERHVTASEQWRDMHAALRELPAKTRRAFVMHVIEGREFSDIAGVMRLSERMVRYHVTNALAHCRARVDLLETP